MRKLFLLFSAAITIASTLQAQNPVIRDQFTADPTARVFNGKVYIYPSHDIPSPIDRLKEWFCMADYHVFSSTNLTDLDRPWCNPYSEQSTLGTARLLLHVGARLCVQRRKILFLFSQYSPR